MVTTTAKLRLFALHGGVALLLLARPASAQVTDDQPPPEDPNAPALAPADEPPAQPPPTAAQPFDTSTLTGQPQPSPSPATQPPPATTPPSTATDEDPNAPMRAPPTTAPPTTAPPTTAPQPAQPTAPSPAPALVLSVDRHLVGPRQQFMLSVKPTGANKLPGNAIQFVITRDGKRVRARPRAEPDGRYSVALPVGSYDAQAVATNTATLTTAYRAEPLTSNRQSLRVVDLRLDAPARAKTGEPFELTATLGDAALRLPVTFSVTPGDAIRGTLAANGTYAATHRLARAGDYTVRAIVQDDSGEQLVSADHRLTVVAGAVPVAAPEPEPEPRTPEPKQPPVADAPPAEALPVTPAPVPWLLIAAAALSLLTLGGAVQWFRGRASASKQPPRKDADAPPPTPRLTTQATVAHDVTFLSPPRLRFRISARAVPDNGRQHIAPPSTPAPKMEDTHGRRADRP